MCKFHDSGNIEKDVKWNLNNTVAIFHKVVMLPAGIGVVYVRAPPKTWKWESARKQRGNFQYSAAHRCSARPFIELLQTWSPLCVNLGSNIHADYSEPYCSAPTLNRGAGPDEQCRQPSVISWAR